jgi:hypothetical protein
LEPICISVVGLIAPSNNAAVHAELPNLLLKVRGGLEMKKNVVSYIIEYGCCNGASAGTDVIQPFQTFNSFIGENKERQWIPRVFALVFLEEFL